VPEAARPPLGLFEVADGHETGVLHALHHQLGDSVPAADLEVGARVGVQDDDGQLVAVAGVDQSGAVGQGDPVAKCQTAARLHEPGVAGGYGNPDPSRDQGPSPTCLDDDTYPRDQIRSGVAGAGVGRQPQLLVEQDDRYVEHAPKVASGQEFAIFAGVLAWMDLEMTGLDPSRHVIVEIATLITDDNLEVVAEGPDLVIGASADELDAMDEVVRTMHTRSGLLDAVRRSTLTVEDASRATLQFLESHIDDAQSVPLCGNSIGTDRRFLARQLPAVDAFLHYRSVDVSTIKELARRWYPDELSRAPRKAGSHRALGDIMESVAELRYYRDAIFRPSGPPQV
jgi:oligoribonuclease